MVDSVSPSLHSLSPSLFSPIRQTVDRPQGFDGERGGEDNIWKLNQFQPLCAASQSANTTTGWFKEKEILIYILDYTLWRICRLEPYGSVLTHLRRGHSVKCLLSVEVQVQPLELFLLPPYPSPSQFPCISSNELSKLANSGKSFFVFSTGKPALQFPRLSQSKKFFLFVC